MTTEPWEFQFTEGEFVRAVVERSSLTQSVKLYYLLEDGSEAHMYMSEQYLEKWGRRLT